MCLFGISKTMTQRRDRASVYLQQQKQKVMEIINKNNQKNQIRES